MNADFLLLMLVVFFYLVLITAGVQRVLAGKRPFEGLCIAPAVVGAIVAGVQLGVGFLQKSRAAKLARRNKRPPLEDNPYTDEQYDITAYLANQGMDYASKQDAMTQSDRTASSSIDAILQNGGSSNNIAQVYDGSQSLVRSMALTDQELKVRNMSNYLNYGLKGKADQERDQFYLNEYVPFKDKAEAATNMSREGMDNIWKGVNTGVGAYMMSRDPYANTERSVSGTAPNVAPAPDYAAYSGSPASMLSSRISANAPGAMGDNLTSPQLGKILSNYFNRPL